jgi:hypothetical protein
MKIILALVLMFAAAEAQAFPFTFGKDSRLMEAPPSGYTMQRLTTLTSDRDKNINYLNILIDANGILGGLYNESDPNNKPGEGDDNTDTFWLRDIESAEGVVLASGRGRKALILKGKLDRETQEGRFTLKYLANGLTMRYENCDFELKRQPNAGPWYVKNIHTGATVTSIHIETHALGLKHIKSICK